MIYTIKGIMNINKMKLTNTRMGFNTDIYQLIEGDVEKLYQFI